jgi:hypothetical protein
VAALQLDPGPPVNVVVPPCRCGPEPRPPAVTAATPAICSPAARRRWPISWPSIA